MGQHVGKGRHLLGGHRRSRAAHAVAQVQSPDLGKRHVSDLAGAVRGPVDRRIVHDDEIAVAGATDIGFHDVDSHGDAMVERKQRIFRRARQSMLHA